MPHAYYDLSDLNAPYDQVPLQGLGHAGLGAGSLGYSGSMGSLSGSLGATMSSGPMAWRDKANPNARVAALQAMVDAWLASHGYNSVGPDGVLGPATCGALKFIASNGGWPPDMLALATEAITKCQGYTTPTKRGTTTGGGGGPLPAKDLPIDTANMYGDKGMSDTMWIVLGSIAAAGAVGAALYFKKKR